MSRNNKWHVDGRTLGRDGGAAREEQCSRGAGPAPGPEQCKNNNCKRANCCTFLPRGAAVHVDGANGEWHSVRVCVCVGFVCVLEVCVCWKCVCVSQCACVCPCLYISLYVCDNVLFKCNNFNCNLPSVTPVTWPPLPQGSAVSACLLRCPVCVCMCVCVTTNWLPACIYLCLTDVPRALYRQVPLCSLPRRWYPPDVLPL